MSLLRSLLLLATLLGVVSASIILPITRTLRPNVAELIAYNQGVDFQLYGGIGSIFEFQVTLQVGTPPQSLSLDIDTGSTDLLVYLPNCSIACSTPNNFNILASSTFHTVSCNHTGYHCAFCSSNITNTGNCGIIAEFGSGAFEEGLVGTDIITLGPYKANGSLGAIYLNKTSDFISHTAQGLVGLAYQTISQIDRPSVFFDIAAQNNLYRSFSMCLTPNEPNIEFGNDYSAFNFQFTPITNESYYSVQLDSVTANGASLGGSRASDQTIVDSGTTLTYINNQSFAAFLDELQNQCNAGVDLVGFCGVSYYNSVANGNCFQLTAQDINNYPTLVYTFAGTTGLVVPPSNYFLTLTDGLSCLGFLSSGAINQNILGDTFMSSFHVVFDSEVAKVGFGPLSSCPRNYSSSISNSASVTQSLDPSISLSQSLVPSFSVTPSTGNQACIKCLNRKCGRSVAISDICKHRLRGHFSASNGRACCSYNINSKGYQTSFKYTGEDSCSTKKLRKLREFCAALNGKASCSIKQRTYVAAKEALFTCKY